MLDPKSIAEFFSGKCVLITGATGFIGKTLVEKLLRSCPDIDKVYVLIRAKKGHTSIEERFEKLVKNSVFNRIRSTTPESLKKIYAISGDIGLPDLNLSSFDKQLLKTDVSIVFHSAASVNFNLDLHKAVEQNVQGTRRIVALCKEMIKFQGLCHVSTAYANCTDDLSLLEEKIYPAPPGAKEILELPIDKICSEFSLEFVNQMKSCRPNAYTYTKSIAEHFLSLESANIPVCIVRPSMVIGSLEEPVPGWIEGLNGPNGVLIGYCTGALKAIYANTELKFNGIPVDMSVNLMIGAAWKTATCYNTPKTLIQVYNCCTPERESIKLSTMLGFAEILACKRYPFAKAVWYPEYVATLNRFRYKLNDICWHYVPALLAEIALRGSKIRPLKLYEQMKKQTEAMEFFMTRSWNFATDNVSLLHNALSLEDRTKFSFKMENFNWHAYAENYAMGARRYIMRDPDYTISIAQKRMTALKLRTMGWKLLLFSWAILLGIVVANVFHNLHRMFGENLNS